MPFYPQLNLGNIASLTTLRHQMDAHEDYFDHPECPYDEDIKDKLRAIMGRTVVEVPVEKIVEVERIVEVEKRIEVAAEGGGKRGPKGKATGVNIDEVATEIASIRNELQTLKTESRGLQTGDKVKIINLRASLVEKLLGMTERVNNVKRLSSFQSTVMGILDDLMSDDLRQEFMRRIEPFATAE